MVYENKGWGCLDSVLGEWYSLSMEESKDQLCPIYRPRSLFSEVSYQFLKLFSNEWKEISIGVGDIAEKILIKKMDEAAILNSGLNVVK